MAKPDEYLSQRADSAVGNIPKFKRVSLGDSAGGGGRGAARAEPAFVPPQVVGFTPMQQGYAPDARETEWSDYPRALGAGSGSAIGALGTAADVVGSSMARLGQRAGAWSTGNYELLDDPNMVGRVDQNFLSRAGREAERVGNVAQEHYIGDMSDAAQQNLSGSFFDDPSLSGLGLRLAMSAPSMALSGGAGLGIRAGALARGATSAQALRSATAGFAGTSAAIQGGSVAQDTYARVIGTPYETIASTNPDGWATALRRAGGNQEIAREIIARQARDISFASAAAISAGTNLLMGAGPTALLGQQPARSLASRVVGREGGQEFLEEGGGRLAGGFAEQGLANENAAVFTPALLAGAEGFVIGRAMDVPSDIGAVRNFIANRVSQERTQPGGAAVPLPENTDVGAPQFGPAAPPESVMSRNAAIARTRQRHADQRAVADFERQPPMFAGGPFAGGQMQQFADPGMGAPTTAMAPFQTPQDRAAGVPAAQFDMFSGPADAREYPGETGADAVPAPAQLYAEQAQQIRERAQAEAAQLVASVPGGKGKAKRVADAQAQGQQIIAAAEARAAQFEQAAQRLAQVDPAGVSDLNQRDLFRSAPAQPDAAAEFGMGVPMSFPEARAPMRPVPGAALPPTGMRSVGAPIGLPGAMPGEMSDLFTGRPGAAPQPAAPAPEAPSGVSDLNQRDLFRADALPQRQQVVGTEARAAEQDVEHIDVIRQQAIALRKKAKLATGPAQESLLAAATALDQQADAARSVALRQNAEVQAAAAGQVSPQARLPAPEGELTTGSLPQSYRGTKLKSWVGMNAAELDAVAASANEQAEQATDAKQKTDYARSAQAATMAAAWLRAGQPKGSLKPPKAASPKVEEPKPAAAKAAPKSMQKPKAEAPKPAAPKAETPAKKTLAVPKPAAPKPAAPKSMKTAAPEKAPKPAETKVEPDKLFEAMRMAATRADAVAAATKLHELGAIDKSTMDDVKAANVKGAEASDIIEAVDDGIARAAEAPKAKGLKKPQPGAATAVSPAAKKGLQSTKKPDDRLYSKRGETAAPGAGVSAGDAQAIVDAALDRLGLSKRHRENVQVVATPEDAGLYGLDDDAKGYFDDANKIAYVFSERNATPDDVLFTLHHELSGHLGLRETYGLKLKAQLAALMDDPAFVKIMEEVRIRDKRGNIDRETLAEEVVSDIAGFNVTDDATLIDRFLVGIDDVIRLALGKGMAKDAATQRRIRVIIANSKRTLRGGNRLAALQAWNTVVRGFAEIGSDARNFKYQFSDSKDFRDHLANVVGGTNMRDWEINTTPSLLTVRNLKSNWRATLDRDSDGAGWSIAINANNVKGESAGAGIYQALMHYARQNGYRLLGDDYVLYEKNELRRSDAMVSAILRAGGDTTLQRPSLWQYTGLLPQDMRDQILEMREDSVDGADATGFGASRLSDLELRAHRARSGSGGRKLSVAEKAELEMLREISKKLEAIRDTHWQEPNKKTDYTTPEGQQKLAELNAKNFTGLSAAFRNRVFMATPDLANLYIGPDGDVLLFDSPVTEFSNFRKAQYLGQFETGTVAKWLRDSGYDPAATGVGVGTASRAALINSMHVASTAARTRGLESPLVTHGARWADPITMRRLADGYNGPLLYSKADAGSEYRETLRALANGNREAAREIAGEATGKLKAVWGEMKDPSVVGAGMGIWHKLFGWMAMRDPNVMSTANLRTVARDTGMFSTEGGKNSFLDLDLATRERSQLQDRWDQRNHDVFTQFDTLSPEHRARVGELMVKSSTLRVDPRKTWEQQPHLHEIPDARADFDSVVADFKALTAEERKLYDDAAKFFADVLDARMALTRKQLGLPEQRGTSEEETKLRADAKLDPILLRMLNMMEAAQHSGVYFPLQRFGEFFVNAKQFDEAGTKEIDRVSMAFETRAEAEAAAEAMRAGGEFNGWKISVGMAGENTAEATHMPAGVRKALDAMITRKVDTGALDKDQGVLLKLNVERLYTEMLPGMQGSKAFLRRKGKHGRGIKGASTDMRRAIANAGKAAAIQLAQLQTADKVADARERMRAHAKSLAETAGDIADPTARKAAQARAFDAQTIVNHMDKVLEADVADLHDAARLIQQLGPMWYLVTPRFYIMQPLQMVTMTLPKLASKVQGEGRDGMIARYRRAGQMITQAYSEAAGPVWEQFGAGGKLDEIRSKLENKDDGKAWFALREKPFEELIGGVIKGEGDMANDEKAMLRTLNERNLISVTMAYEVMNAAKQSNQLWQKVVKGAMWPAQNLELANRLATGLAAYRLARADGMTHEASVDYADEVVTETQVDYSEANRPWLLSSKFLGNAAPLAMFQMYRQNMMWNTIYYGRKMLAGDKEATRFFMGMMATHALFAGAVGLPLIGGAVATIGLLADVFDDEDEPEYNVMEEIRSGLSEFIGQNAATAVMYGVPRGFVGGDMHNSMGLNSVFLSSYKTSATGADAAKEAIVSAMGVPGSFVVNGWDAWEKVSQGDYLGGFKSISPKLVKDTIKAGEAATIGLETKNGYVAVEPSFVNAAFHLMGVTPREYANYYDARGVETEVRKAITSRKAEIYDAMAKAETLAEKREARQALKAFNAANPGAKITEQGLASAMRARAESTNRFKTSTLGLSDRDREALGEYLTPYQTEKE